MMKNRSLFSISYNFVCFLIVLHLLSQKIHAQESESSPEYPPSETTEKPSQPAQYQPKKTKNSPSPPPPPADGPGSQSINRQQPSGPEVPEKAEEPAPSVRSSGGPPGPSGRSPSYPNSYNPSENKGPKQKPQDGEDGPGYERPPYQRSGGAALRRRENYGEGGYKSRKQNKPSYYDENYESSEIEEYKSYGQYPIIDNYICDMDASILVVTNSEDKYGGYDEKGNGKYGGEKPYKKGYNPRYKRSNYPPPETAGRYPPAYYGPWNYDQYNYRGSGGPEGHSYPPPPPPPSYGDSGSSYPRDWYEMGGDRSGEYEGNYSGRDGYQQGGNEGYRGQVNKYFSGQNYDHEQQQPQKPLVPQKPPYYGKSKKYSEGSQKYAKAHRLRCSVIANGSDEDCQTCCQLAARKDRSVGKHSIYGFIVDYDEIRYSEQAQGAAAYYDKQKRYKREAEAPPPAVQPQADYQQSTPGYPSVDYKPATEATPTGNAGTEYGSEKNKEKYGTNGYGGSATQQQYSPGASSSYGSDGSKSYNDEKNGNYQCVCCAPKTKY